VTRGSTGAKSGFAQASSRLSVLLDGRADGCTDCTNGYIDSRRDGIVIALLTLFFKTFVGFFAVMDPIGVVPLFIVMTQGTPRSSAASWSAAPRSRRSSSCASSV